MTAPNRRQRAPRLGAEGVGARRARFVVPAALDGERLDKALAAGVPDLSRGLARKIIDMGGVYLGVDRCRVASKPLAEGDVLTVTWHPDVLVPERFPLAVLHTDPRVLVVDKPAGQLSQGSELGDVGSLAHALEKRFGASARLMHRLDKPASGLLVVGRDPEAVAHLTPQVREHTMTRHYYAVAAGAPAAGPCTLPLVKDGRGMRVAHPDEPGALPARSDVEVLGGAPGRTLVRVTLHTGRTHQISLHLAALGAPLVGDELYGGPPAPRLCLHAAHLGFIHPDGRYLSFDLAPPEDFWAAAQLDPSLITAG